MTSPTPQPRTRRDRTRLLLSILLTVVAAAAAVLSFAALRDLALACGFSLRLAWLLPVVVDAGAAAGSLVWLGGRTAPSARTFARALALALLGLSVAANALGHALAAFGLAPAWWVVVLVSAIAPAVLGAVVHLAVLAGRPAPADVDEEPAAESEPVVDAELLDERGLSYAWQYAPPVADDRAEHNEFQDAPEHDRAAALIAAGAGRRRLSRELGVTEYEARQLLARTRSTDTTADTDTEPDEDRTEEIRVPVLNGATHERSTS